MEINQRLSERMAYDTKIYGPDDPGWNQWVRDHKEFLRSKAVKRTFTPEKMTDFRYRPEEFFVENEGVVQATWIWMFINDIRDLTEFDGSRIQFHMLDRDVIADLYSVYRGSESSTAETEGA